MSATPQQPPQSLTERMTQSFDARIPPHVRSVITRRCIEPLAPNPTIVDLGCGPALWLRAVAEARPDAMVIGYDRDPEAIEAARRLNLPHATWHQADLGAADFALPPASADVVAMHFFFHFFDDPRALLRTTRAALKPGGSLIMTGWVRSSIADFFDFFLNQARQTMESALPAEQRGGPDPEATALRMWASFNRYTLDDWRWLLRHEGFTIRRADQYTSHFAYLIATKDD